MQAAILEFSDSGNKYCMIDVLFRIIRIFALALKFLTMSVIFFVICRLALNTA